MRSIVTDRVAWSVGLSVTIVSPAKTAKPIEMPFGLWTGVGPRKYVLDGLQIPHAEEQFWGEKGRPIVNYRDSVASCEKTTKPIEMPFGMLSGVSPRKHLLYGVWDPPCARAILRGKGRPIVKYRDLLPWAVKKTAEPIEIRLENGPELAQGSICQITGVHIGARWRTQLNCPCAAAMRPFLSDYFWPLVRISV